MKKYFSSSTKMEESDEIRLNTMNYICDFFQCTICGSKEVICQGFRYACAVGDPGYWHDSKSEHHGKVFIVPDPKDCIDTDSESDSESESD
jgi:hypothetical protein